MSHADIEAEVEAMRQAILTGRSVPRTARVNKKAASSKPPRGANLKDRPPVYDREEIRALVDKGLTVTEVAVALGAHRASMWRIIKQMGLTPTPGVGGARKKVQS